MVVKSVLKVLTDEQKEYYKQITLHLQEYAENILKSGITVDKPWLCGYNLEMKAQSSHWKTAWFSATKNAEQVHSQVKKMQTVFYNYEGMSIMSNKTNYKDKVLD